MIALQVKILYGKKYNSKARKQKKKKKKDVGILASLAEKDKGLLKDSETERALDSFWNIPELLRGSRVVRLEAGSRSRLLPCSLLSLIVISFCFPFRVAL